MAVTTIEEYGAQAAAWLAENMEFGQAEQLGEASGITPERLALQRVLQRKLFDGGYAGITWPREYGGQGLSEEYEQAFRRQAAPFVLPDFGVAGQTTFGICLPTMLATAAPSFLSRHVPRVLAGEELWVQFFSEPDAGSDLAGVTTRAVRDGSRWILSGSKIWTSGAYYADWGMCLARTNWDVPKHRGLTWFGVPTDAPGLTVRRIEQINGDAEFCEEFFDEVEVGDENVIGEVDRGWELARTLLSFERSSGATFEASLDDISEFAPDLVAFARRSGRASDPLARQLLGQAQTNDYVVSSLSTYVLEQMRWSTNEAVASAMTAYSKLARGTFGPLRGRIGMQLAGLEGVSWPSDDGEGKLPARGYLDGRQPAIAGGTNEMQRNAIGERVLDLPREANGDIGIPFSEVVGRRGS